MFYLCVALGKGQRKFPLELLSADVFLAINDRIAALIQDYDLYQLSQIGMFMSGPNAINYVPDEFWTQTMEKALNESLDEFREHQDLIAKE